MTSVKLKKLIIAGLTALIVGSLMILVFVYAAEAKTYSGKMSDKAGNMYIMKNGKARTGLFKYNGRYYYGFKTKSKAHQKGSLATDCHMEINGRWYYFTHSGKAQNKDSHYLDIRTRNHTVRYIYTPGSNKTERYNTKLHRYQKKIRQKNGKKKWVTVGMQCYPYGQMEWQY